MVVSWGAGRARPKVDEMLGIMRLVLASGLYVYTYVGHDRYR